jgi:cell division protein FtsI/penicillin-binding protein 2
MLLKFLFALGFLAIVTKLASIQIIEAPLYQARARKQHEQRVSIPALRGRILDRNGNVLVSNTNFVSFAANPQIVARQTDRLALACSEAFGRPASLYRSRLRNSSKQFVWLERRVRPDAAAKFNHKGIKGIIEIPEAKRLYHYGTVAGPLLGFADIDNMGIAGLELQFHEHLRGQHGSIIMQKDAFQNKWPSADYPRIEPVDGDDLVLTIDLAFQAVLRDELQKAVASNKADGGLAILVQPQTGEILAVASSPSIDANDLGSIELKWARNRVVTDMFEPGSIFKIVTASAAYEYQLISPERTFNAEKGLYRVYHKGRLIQRVRDEHEHDVLTFQEAIEQSSNIIMAKASEIIGPERLYRQARDFGFGIPTGIEIPGEVRGRLKKPQEWSGTSLRTMAYGYEVAVTPLQMVMAYAAIANGGVLMSPAIVREIRTHEGAVLRRSEPEKIRRVVSHETADLLSRAFRGVVERGTAQEALSPGISIAGKTGTARRYVNGRYERGDYIASFAGWFPAVEPRVVALVMLENPRNRSYYGGQVSAPVVRALAERILQVSPHIGGPEIVATSNPESDKVTVPDVRMIQASIAATILQERGLACDLFGAGDVVLRQNPKPGTALELGGVVHLSVDGSVEQRVEGITVMPNLRGMSLRRALNRSVLEDFIVQINGSGTVVAQSPSPGQRVRAGAHVTLACEPKGIATAVLY